MPTGGPLLARESPWLNLLVVIGDWSAWLAGNDDAEKLEVLRRSADMGLPCGSESFVLDLENSLGRDLRFRPRGRPKAQ